MCQWIECGVVVDLFGNVAMFDIHGNEIWERHLNSAIPNTPTAGTSNHSVHYSLFVRSGDVTGNGALEIVIGTVSGHLHVLDAKTGQDKAPFPFRSGCCLSVSGLIG